MEDLKLGLLSNKDLTKEIISEIDGISYYPNFLTDKDHDKLVESLKKIDYQIVNGRPTKYFGLNYTHQKKIHNKNIEEIPHFLNLLEPLDIKMDQLVIEYFRANDGHSPICESELFDDTIILLPMSSSFKYELSNKDHYVSFLVEPKSLLILSGKSRKYKRAIRPRVKERFNGYTIPRKEFYLFTYRNIKRS